MSWRGIKPLNQSETSYKNYLSSQHTKAANSVKAACSALDRIVSGSTDDEINLIIGSRAIEGALPCK